MSSGFTVDLDLLYHTRVCFTADRHCCYRTINYDWFKDEDDAFRNICHDCANTRDWNTENPNNTVPYSYAVTICDHGVEPIDCWICSTDGGFIPTNPPTPKYKHCTRCGVDHHIKAFITVEKLPGSVKFETIGHATVCDLCHTCRLP
jgi:hypothetical protein